MSKKISQKQALVTDWIVAISTLLAALATIGILIVAICEAIK